MKFIDKVSRVLKRETFEPLVVAPGDTLELTYTDENGDSTKVLETVSDDYYYITEAVAFVIDDDDYKGIGGAFLQKL